MIETKDLTLTVEKQVPGELITNALAIESFVAERIKDFTPEKYYDDPEMAKKDRAVLNAAAKDLNSRRLSLEREFMSPFEPVKAAIKRATDMLTSGANKLGEVWDAVEETRRNEKRREIEEIFSGMSFSLVQLSRLFDERWLNKGVSIKEATEELAGKTRKIYDDIKVIEALSGAPDDIAQVKASYLDTLDIGSALAAADRMRSNRERIAEEEKARAEREHVEHIEAQESELATDALQDAKSDKIASVAAAALEVENDPVIEYTLRFRGTRAQLLALRSYMTSQGIEYDKI